MGFNKHQRGAVFDRVRVVPVFVLQLRVEFFHGAKEATGAKEYALFRLERRQNVLPRTDWAYLEKRTVAC